MFHVSRISTILSFVLLAGCTPPDSDQAEDTGNLMGEITITGSLTYRERIALPPGSVAQVTLSDISVADAAAPIIAETSIELGDRQVPVPFELTVRGDDLEPGRRYGVRAVIRDPDGRLVWTTDTANPIDAGETQIDLGTLLLVRAGSEGGEWVVEDIAGKGIVDDSRATLNFGEDGNLTGHGSCNSYGATWKLSGEGVTVEQGRATLMACSPELDAQEKEFLRLLAAANHFDITEDGALVIETANGETIRARRE